MSIACFRASVPALGLFLLLAGALCADRPAKEPAVDARRDATASPAPVQFRDVAEEAGLRFRWGHGGRTPLNIRDTAGGGCGFLDFDRDGYLDVLLIGDRVALYQNRGDGTFADVSTAAGLSVRGALMGCAVGDYDNDGFPDVYITGHGVAKLYRNTAASAEHRPLFRDVTDAVGVGPRGPHDWSTSAGFADLDGDGLLDLAVCRYILFTPQGPRLCEMETPAGEPVPGACPPFYYEPQTLRVYRNRGGSGGFEEVTARFPKRHGNSLGIGFADFDGDGRTDLYVANDGEAGDLYRNGGGWRFENVGTASGTAYGRDGHEQAGMGVDWGDYDGDGRLDLVVATFQNEPRSLYRNVGNGLFAHASEGARIGDTTRTSLSFGVAFADFDNDAHLDLIFANGHVQDTVSRIDPSATYRQAMLLFRNQGDGTFAAASNEGGAAFRRPIVGRALAPGDYNNDGRMDALIVDLEGAPLLLRNTGAGTNHWVGVRLVNTAGSDALGTRVTLETERGLRRVAEARTCRSYLSASDPRVHFGLGRNDRVARLTVRWPGGRTAVLRSPPADRYLTVHEPAAR
jgi:enediyne biosynthesis protein E4